MEFVTGKDALAHIIRGSDLYQKGDLDSVGQIEVVTRIEDHIGSPLPDHLISQFYSLETAQKAMDVLIEEGLI